MSVRAQIDRPAEIRRALRNLIAQRGFHGTSMSLVARTAGVATGTAYVHYESKEELVYATYVEIKSELGEAVLAALDENAEPEDRFRQIWKATLAHLLEEPRRAAFLVQLEVSPFYAEAHQRVMKTGDVLMEQATKSDMMQLLVPLPAELLYQLSIGLAVHIAAAQTELTDDQLETLISSSWRAISVS
jgi:TetR/AcrR family transcriptional repressor of multidrug resistance operon